MKFTVGDIVQLTFLDHCRRTGFNVNSPAITFEVFGKLLKETKRTYVVGTWVEANGTLDDNTETFTIVKSTITKARRLK